MFMFTGFIVHNVALRCGTLRCVAVPYIAVRCVTLRVLAGGDLVRVEIYRCVVCIVVVWKVNVSFKLSFK